MSGSTSFSAFSSDVGSADHGEGLPLPAPETAVELGAVSENSEAAVILSDRPSWRGRCVTRCRDSEIGAKLAGAVLMMITVAAVGIGVRDFYQAGAFNGAADAMEDVCDAGSQASITRAASGAKIIQGSVLCLGGYLSAFVLGAWKFSD